MERGDGIEIGWFGRGDNKGCVVGVDGVIHSIGNIVDSQHSEV